MLRVGLEPVEKDAGGIGQSLDHMEAGQGAQHRGLSPSISSESKARRSAALRCPSCKQGFGEVRRSNVFLRSVVESSSGPGR